MFLDVNIVLQGFRDTESDEARAIGSWLRSRIGRERLAICDVVLAGVIRIATNPRVYATPATPAGAVEYCDALLGAPSVALLRPGTRHWPIFTGLVTSHRLRGNDVPDAYLAAVALEYGATMVTRDRGFVRYGLPLLDPLA